MAEIRRIGDLEIDEDIAFQERSWRLQRVCWMAMAIIIAAGLLGLLGSGPLARGSIASRDGMLQLVYPRLGRLGAPCRLEVHLRAASSDEVRIWLSNAYLDAIPIERVEPPPIRVEAGPDRSAYVVRLGGPAGTAVATFTLRPVRIGRVEAEVSLDDGAAVGFGQFVYP